MKWVGIALFLIGHSAFAAKGFDLKMEIRVDGREVSSTRILTPEGETKTIKSGNNLIEVVATESSESELQGISMNFTISTINEKGEKTLLSTPRIIALENEPAQMTMREKEGGPEKIFIEVVAKRTTI